tara:strand:- start:36 stop:263 length:228 start_codon:yes stop_codon:yes gene_type:complete
MNKKERDNLINDLSIDIQTILSYLLEVEYDNYVEFCEYKFEENEKGNDCAEEHVYEIASRLSTILWDNKLTDLLN